MPLYEYQCDRCAHRFEVIQKFSDPPVASCQKCGGEVKKLLSSPAIQFKGTGWYITDYARGGNTGKAAGGGEKDAKSDTGPASDAKPAADTPATATKAETKSDNKSGSKAEGKPS